MDLDKDFEVESRTFSFEPYRTLYHTFYSPLVSYSVLYVLGAIRVLYSVLCASQKIESCIYFDSQIRLSSTARAQLTLLTANAIMDLSLILPMHNKMIGDGWGVPHFFLKYDDGHEHFDNMDLVGDYYVKRLYKNPEELVKALAKDDAMKFVISQLNGEDRDSDYHIIARYDRDVGDHLESQDVYCEDLYHLFQEM